MKKVSSRVYIFQKILDYLGVAFLGILLLFIWQLYRGPIEVPFLKPYIMQALNNDASEATISVDKVSIELVRSLQPIKIVAKDIIYKRADNSVDIKAPRTTVSFSLKALMRGVIAPSSIAIEKPVVYIFNNYGIKEDEKKETGKKQLSYYFKILEDFLERFNSDDNSYVESYINNIEIKHGELELHEVDLGRKWSFSDLNYQFSRNLLNITTDINALLRLGDTFSPIGFEGEYKQLQQKLLLTFYFSELVPKNLSDMFLDNNMLKTSYQINVPVSGKISTIIDIKNVLDNKNDITKLVDTAFDNINFQFEGGQGNITSDNNIEDEYKISSFLLDGHILGGIDKVSIHDASFDLGKQNASLDFEITGFKNYFLEQSLKDLKLRLTAAINHMEVDKLYDYWPKFVATPGWKWCYESMRGGTFSDAEFVFDFGINEKGEFGFIDLQGTGKVEGVSLDYLTGMPKIVNAKGSATFTSHNIRIDANSGESEGVQLTGGYVNLYDLDKEDNFADISLEMESSVKDALKIIDNKPLQYTSQMGLNPNVIEGFAKTKLGLKFEMKQNLTPSEVIVDVVSTVNDFKMNNIIQDKSITAESLELKVDNNGLFVSGNAKLDEIPIKLSWIENFSSKDYRSRYNIGFEFNDNLEKELGLNLSVLQPPFISGYADINADITVYDDHKTTIDLNGKLNNMDIDFAFLGYHKPINEDGEISAILEFNDNKLTSVPSLSLSNASISMKGKLDIDAKNRINVVDISSIQGAKTDAKAKIHVTYEPKTKIKVNVSGQSYDLSPLFEKKEKPTDTNPNKALSNSGDDDSLEDTLDADIYIAVSNLWTNPYIAVTNFAGSAKLVNGIGIEEIHMVGNYKNGKNSVLKFDYVPRLNNEFYLSVDSNDAGATLKVLRLYDDMEGGNLRIEARRTKEKALIGHAKIRNFNIHNTPLIAKFLTVASFSGMLDLLTGEGLAFSHLDAPFEYNKKQLMLKHAKAFGNVLGVTANGTYDRNYEEMDIRGQVAPAYSLNMILGKIPLVGSLLAGKDGTVFAADYYISGATKDAEIKINPLSALSPNSLKETISSLFGTLNE